jgi:protein involved in polysaccharide export with SLBB domain
MLRAPWQERLTLGPGDSMSISMYGQPDLTRSEIFVGPDGCVTYLYAQNVQAAGLTIDELRARLNEVMGRYYQNPRVIVTPTAFQSKRVYLLGKIVDKGIVVLDRPMTILEAVAAARGLEVGLYQLNTVELADLPRSLLVRRGRKMPVDFEKLFLHGDLTQNLPLEPDDYLYFPSSNTNEFHVLGSVKNPGTQGLTSQSTVVSALTTAGSFTDKAWRQRVLVVRGSLDKPQTFVVDVKAVLSGRAKDFRLEPRDIVYVSDHPWDRAVELLDLAVGAFTQAAVATWTGANIGPAIARPLLPQL